MGTIMAIIGNLMSLLTIIFEILKVTNVIDWEWIWVFSPLWIGAIISCISAILYACTLSELKGEKK